MSIDMNISAEQWVSIIADNELPAITSTAKMLDKFSSDDVSSLPKLSKAILHDQALSSCILKVANSVQYISVNKVTTVSRATVVLGIHAVKNICLTSRLIDGLLVDKSLSDPVYQRLLKLMANSFYAGLLAKMMVAHYSDNVQEQVYLAAMLYRIGETSFWSVGSEAAEQLIKQEHLSDDDFLHLCETELGISFTSLSKGLAETWNLGDLLAKSLDHPETRTVEMQIISLADKLSRYISQPPYAQSEFTKVLEDIAKLMKISVPRLTKRINAVRENAINLLNLYGAKQLTPYINALPQEVDFSRARTAASSAVNLNNELLLSHCMELTRLAQTQADFNALIEFALKSTSTIFSFHRCTFFMLNEDKSLVKARFAYNAQGRIGGVNTAINIDQSENIFSLSLNKNKPLLVNDFREQQWRDYINESVENFIDEGAIVLVPIRIRNQVIGLLCGQLLHSKALLSETEFQQLTFFVEQLSMCLTTISHH